MRLIEIVPARPGWAEEYARLAERLVQALGPLALRIDHIGSTAVPGLDAKDVIDVQVTVAELDPPTLDPGLHAAGLVRRSGIVVDHVPPGREGGDPAEWQKLFYGAADGERRVHVHVRQAGRANQRYPLLFRDYLRAEPAAAEAYARVKRALAQQHPTDIDAYLDVKDPVCDLIVQAAEAWAATCSWTPELDPLRTQNG